MKYLKLSVIVFFMLLINIDSYSHPNKIKTRKIFIRSGIKLTNVVFTDNLGNSTAVEGNKTSSASVMYAIGHECTIYYEYIYKIENRKANIEWIKISSNQLTETISTFDKGWIIKLFFQEKMEKGNSYDEVNYGNKTRKCMSKKTQRDIEIYSAASFEDNSKEYTLSDAVGAVIDNIFDKPKENIRRYPMAPINSVVVIKSSGSQIVLKDFKLVMFGAASSFVGPSYYKDVMRVVNDGATTTIPIKDITAIIDISRIRKGDEDCKVSIILKNQLSINGIINLLGVKGIDSNTDLEIFISSAVIRKILFN